MLFDLVRGAIMGINSDFFRAIKTLSETNPNTWEAFVDAHTMQEVIDYMGDRQFVNVYMLSRECGGPEEGGWYYDSGSAVLSIETTREHTDAIAEMLAEEFPNHGNRYSVIYYSKPADHSVDIEDAPAADWSDYQPYE